MIENNFLWLQRQQWCQVVQLLSLGSQMVLFTHRSDEDSVFLTLLSAHGSILFTSSLHLLSVWLLPSSSLGMPFFSVPLAAFSAWLSSWHLLWPILSNSVEQMIRCRLELGAGVDDHAMKVLQSTALFLMRHVRSSAHNRDSTGLLCLRWWELRVPRVFESHAAPLDHFLVRRYLGFHIQTCEVLSTRESRGKFSFRSSTTLFGLYHRPWGSSVPTVWGPSVVCTAAQLIHAASCLLLCCSQWLSGLATDYSVFWGKSLTICFGFC